MATDITAPVPLQTLASKLDIASPEKSPVKGEHSSSPPPPIKDTSGILEDGEIDERQDLIGSLRTELQLSTFKYSALEDRFKRLERQHNELQDLASAYSEVIRGLSLTDGQTVSIDQLQAEAGRDGLRAKALEADVLRPLIREAGGLQPLISQTHTMRSLVDKAGGLRELEQFVSDLRTIRDTLDELRGSQGLGGLASEVRDLLKSKQQHAVLESEVNGQDGLRLKAARYEKLVQAFAEAQAVSSFQKRNATALTARPPRSRATNHKSPSINHGQPAGSQQSLTGPVSMNPARARMISATPLEADPDRDLYEAPPPIAKPSKKTGANDTPLGMPQVQQPTTQVVNQDASSSTLKRKGPGNTTSSVPAKRPRVDISRASPLAQAFLAAATDGPAKQAVSLRNPPGGQRARAAASEPRTRDNRTEVKEVGPSETNATGVQVGAAAFKTQGQSSRGDGENTLVGDAVSRLQKQTVGAQPKMPEWICTSSFFGDVGFSSTAGARIPTYSSTPPLQDAEPHADARLGPVRFPANGLEHPSLLSEMKMATVSGAQTALQAAAIAPLDPRYNQLSIWKGYLRYPVAFWTGASDANAAWDAYQLYDLKRNFQVPSDLLATLAGELSKHIPIAKYSLYETMTPNPDTCILRYLIDGHRPSGLPQERTTCRLCTHQCRPCALLQDVGGVRTIMFMPLRPDLRLGLKWSDKAFWIKEMQHKK